MDFEEKYKKKVIVLLKALFPQAKIILFGSRARRTDIRGSDVDIALDTGEKLDIVAVGEAREILNAAYMPYKFDVVDFHSVNKDMQEMILQEGVVWSS